MTAPGARLGEIWPPLSEFRSLAKTRRVIPVVMRVLADGETPLGVYRKLARDGVGTFLLESAEHDSSGVHSMGRHSIIGAAAPLILTETDGRARWSGPVPAGVPESGPIMDVLRETLTTLRSDALAGLPPLTGGLVGHIGWDAGGRWETLPRQAVDDLRLPEVFLALARDLAVYDHAESTCWLVSNAINADGSPDRVDEAHAAAASRVEEMARSLARPTPSTVAVQAAAGRGRADDERGAAKADAREHGRTRSLTTPEEYEATVRRAKDAIRDGEVFQIVPSQRFDVDCEADPVDVYRMLRLANPSPYLYLLRAEDATGRRYDVVGSSPEALVTLEFGRLVTHPIAGTRPRGADRAEDEARAAELAVDAKERAEHVMLVDLARNDLSRVAEPGSVAVTEFMETERYSHVMHLVSTVEARLAPGLTAYDALRSAFPAGTLSGAPKIRAMELIDELEPVRRGVYGGAVGYFDFDGNMDMAIAIRTAVIEGGVAHVQAGAGIVADSDPASEQAECVAKAAAVIQAVRQAGSLAPIEGGQ